MVGGGPGGNISRHGIRCRLAVAACNFDMHNAGIFPPCRPGAGCKPAVADTLASEWFPAEDLPGKSDPGSGHGKETDNFGFIPFESDGSLNCSPLRTSPLNSPRAVRSDIPHVDLALHTIDSVSYAAFFNYRNTRGRNSKFPKFAP